MTYFTDTHTCSLETNSPVTTLPDIPPLDKDITDKWVMVLMDVLVRTEDIRQERESTTDSCRRNDVANTHDTQVLT